MLPTVLLSAFAYQAVEAERKLRLAERSQRLQEKAEGVVRELDELLREAAQRIGEEAGKQRELRSAREAGARLRRQLPADAFAESLLILDREGRRVWPPGRPVEPRPRRTGAVAAMLGGTLGACMPHEPVNLVLLADAISTSDREGALAILERVARTAATREVRAAALWDLGLLHQAGTSPLSGLLNALEVYKELAALPIGLVDQRGRNSPAQARLRLALVQRPLGSRKAYLDGLHRLIAELEKDPQLLPPGTIAELAERAGSLLELEGEGPGPLARARAVSARRQQEEQACQRIEELFAPGISRVLRETQRGTRDEPALLKERLGERELLVVCSALPPPRAGGPSLGLVVVPLAAEPLGRALRARVARTRGAELVAYPSRQATGPDIQEAALRAPLEHLGVRVRDLAEEGPALGVQGFDLKSDTVRLWAIALSIGGIVGGVLATLRTARREAKAAQLKSDWVSNVTHELKTPLTSIRMFLDTLLLGRVEDEAEAKECLQVMSREAERLTRLIDQLLSFSRIESKKIRLRLAFVAPRKLVDEALGVLADQLGRPVAALGIEVVGVQELPEIAVDRIAVVEAILNLLHNAWKYSPGPDRKVRVVLTARRRMVEIAVEDNGMGVPRRDRRRIFVKFERGTNAEAARIEGSGIGLTVADSIVRAHGGRMEYAPLKPKGSRFSIFLPK